MRQALRVAGIAVGVALVAAGCGQKTEPGLFVVAQDHLKKLHEYLSRILSGSDHVQLIVDRRSGDRRQRSEKVAVERRQYERRSPDADAKVRSRGYTYVGRP